MQEEKQFVNIFPEMTTKVSESPHHYLLINFFTILHYIPQFCTQEEAAAAALQKYDDLLQSYEDRDDRCDKPKNDSKKTICCTQLTQLLVFYRKEHHLMLFF